MSGVVLRRLVAISALGVVIRLSVRAYSGAADFWTNGYTLYFDLAHSMVSDHQFVLSGSPTLLRPPVYPLLLAAVTGGERDFWPAVVLQSVIGGLTCLGAGVLAFDMFASASAAIAATAITALYPYYLVHDTALQETGLFTMCTLWSVIALSRLQRHPSVGRSIAGGIALGITLLVRATLVPFAAAVPLLILVAGRASVGQRVRSAIVLVVAMGAVLLPWLVRSYRLTGAVVIVSETGNQLWSGNNPWTFSAYPQGSIDVSVGRAYDAMTQQDRDQIASRAGNEVLVDHWFLERARAYMVANPGLTVLSGVRKLGATLSPIPSPRRSLVPTLVHAASYGGVLTLALLGMVRNRATWQNQIFILFNICCFLIVTAVFFGHTSHRAYIDVYLITYASHTLMWLAMTFGVMPREIVRT